MIGLGENFLGDENKTQRSYDGDNRKILFQDTDAGQVVAGFFKTAKLTALQSDTPLIVRTGRSLRRIGTASQ